MRVDIASTPQTNERIQVAPYGPFSHAPLQFSKSQEAGVILLKAWSWLRENEDSGDYFLEHAARLVDAMFITSNGETVGKDMVNLFEGRVETASATELKLMAASCAMLTLRSPSPTSRLSCATWTAAARSPPDQLDFIKSELHASVEESPSLGSLTFKNG